MHYRDSFKRLGLENDADTKSIRRAYARELKLIDQEHDPAGFQALREAYEAALARTAQQPPPVPAPAPAPAPAPPGLQPDAGSDLAVAAAALPAAHAAEHPGQLALAAFADMQTATAQLVASQVSRPSQWEQVLRQFLDDERLLNLHARNLFEAHIAHLLVSGWQPGNDLPFATASRLFHWMADPQRLRQLGRAGAILDQALAEQTTLHTLGETQEAWSHAILDLIRKGTPVSDHQLRADMVQLACMVTYFPTWMGILVDPDAVRQWETRFRALPPIMRSLLPPVNLRKLGYVVLAAMAVYLLFFHQWRKPGSEGFFQPQERAAPPVQLPSDVLQQLDARMAEFPTPALPPGVHRADFTVMLDAQGNVLSTVMLRTSDSAGYDDAAIKAIRATAPFPPGVPREFTVSFTIGPRP